MMKGLREESKSATLNDERNAGRPRAMKEDYVENNQPSAERRAKR